MPTRTVLIGSFGKHGRHRAEGRASIAILAGRRLATVALLALEVGLSSEGAALAANACVWNASASPSNWSASSSWTSCGSTTPQAADTVTFNGTKTTNCNIDANVSVTSISINSGYTGTVTQNSTKTITTSGAFTMGNGTTGDFVGGDSAMTIGTDLSVLSGSSSAFTSTTGTLTVGGDLTINDGLVGYWKLDENTGTAITDASGFGNDGTLNNTSWVSGANLPTLNYDNTSGVSFNGSTAYATLGVNSLPAVNGSMTIAFWMYYASVPAGQQNAVVLKSATPGNIQIGFLSSKISAFKGGAGLLVAATSTPTSGWHHVAYTYNGSNLNSLYVDGGTAATSATATDSGTPTTAWLGNYTNSGGSPFGGRLDDVRIYNRVLSATEVASLAAGSQPNTSIVTRTLAGSSVISGDLVIGSGTLAGGNTAIQVKGNWWNYGGIFTTGTTGGVTFNGTATGKTIRASSSDFNSVTINGSGGAWTMSDTGGVVLEKDLAISAGTLTAPASTTLEIRGAFNKTGGTFTHNSGTVLLSSGTSQAFASNSTTFNNLTINDGLVGYWKLDEASGSTATDSSGFGNDGTYTGSPTHASSSPPANFTDPTYVTLNGTSQYVQLGNPTNMNFSGQITMATWAYYTASATYNDMVEHGYTQSPNGGVYLRQANSVYECGRFDTSGTDYKATYAVPGADLNAWVHLACVYDGAAWRLYRNGALVASTTTANGSMTVGGNWGIGATGSGSRFFHGSLDDVRIYNRGLTATEVSALANGDQPGTSAATQTLSGAPTIAGDLVIASGKLAAGTNTVTVGGNWLNYGGLYTTGTSGSVVFNGSGTTNKILSAGSAFQDVSVTGSGTWTLSDRMEIDPARSLTLTSGNFDLSSYTLRTGDINRGTNTLTPSTGTVVLDAIASQTLDTGTFTNLKIEPVGATNLVGYWKLDEGTGLTAKDYSANGNDGTLTAGPTWVDSGLPGAVTFDNAEAITFVSTVPQYVTLGTIPATLRPTTVTMSAWYKSSGIGSGESGGEIISGSDRYTLRVLSTTQVMLQKRTGASTWVNVTATVTTPLDGNWHHIAGVIDPSNATAANRMILYFDGSPAGTGTDSAAIDYGATLTEFRIGSDAANGSFDFNGTIDEVRIYDTALSAAQIAALKAGTFPVGLSGTPTYTLGHDTTVSGTFAINNGTVASAGYTMDASSTTNVPTVYSGTYSVGSVTNKFEDGLTVNKYGTLNLPTSGGIVSIGPASASTKVLTIDGTLSASSTGATIQKTSGANNYTFTVGSSSTATPTLNISGLAVKNTDTNGMYINTVAGSSTTFTEFDNLAFSNGTGNYLLRIYATSLSLYATGLSFDASTTSNVKLAGNGTGDGETRTYFGGTCTNSPCEAYDADDDNSPAASGTAPGIAGDGTGENSGDMAVAEWLSKSYTDTAGSIQGFPTNAFNWNTFAYWNTYVAYNNYSGSTDRLLARDQNGAYLNSTGVAGTGYYWDLPSNGDHIIGTPRWDMEGSTHYVYVLSDKGYVYKLSDSGTGFTLVVAQAWPYHNGASATATSPLAMDSSNVYWAGNDGSGAKKIFSLSFSMVLNGTQTITADIVAAPSIATVSGTSYLFTGTNGKIYKAPTDLSSITNSTQATSTVYGRVTVLNGAVYFPEDIGKVWSLSATTLSTTNWSYQDTDGTRHPGGCTAASQCTVRNLYIDPATNRTYFGDKDGHLYVLSSAGAVISASYPFRPGASTDEFQTAPLYRSGVVVIGAVSGKVFIVDQSAGTTYETYNFQSAISTISYNTNGQYIVGTASGKLFYINGVTDPTPGST